MEELNARLEKIAEHNEARERAAALRAGLIAAAVYNVNRRKGMRMLKAKDFVRSKPKELSPEQVGDELLRWARAVNKDKQAS